MFKIKMLCHDLSTRNIDTYIDFVNQTFYTPGEALIVMNKCIADELETLNANSENDFKVTYSDERALAIVQCWEGKESEMSEEELESDRCCYDVTLYDIVWTGTAVDLSLPEKYIN